VSARNQCRMMGGDELQRSGELVFAGCKHVVVFTRAVLTALVTHNCKLQLPIQQTPTIN
jgi:hypothetical protein